MEWRHPTSIAKNSRKLDTENEKRIVIRISETDIGTNNGPLSAEFIENLGLILKKEKNALTKSRVLN